MSYRNDKKYQSSAGCAFGGSVVAAIILTPVALNAMNTAAEYKTGYEGGLLFIVLCLWALVAFTLFGYIKARKISAASLQEETALQESEKQAVREFIEKHSIADDAVPSVIYSSYLPVILNEVYFVWSDDSNLYLVNREQDTRFDIPRNEIQSFSFKGEQVRETKVSGGGGGGADVAGAVLGGMLAGGVGAIIGSRGKIEEIKSETITRDLRKTVLAVNNQGEIKYIFFHSGTVYDYLLVHIPEKEITYVN